MIYLNAHNSWVGYTQFTNAHAYKTLNRWSGYTYENFRILSKHKTIYVILIQIPITLFQNSMFLFQCQTPFAF